MFVRTMLCLLVGLSFSMVSLASEPAVEGSFTGDGKPAKLAFISATKGEPLSDKPTIRIIMTEKDHSKTRNAAMKAGFGDFGSALIITVFEDGKICGCEVAHEAHQRKPFSSIGSIATSDFKIANGQITSKLATEGEVDTFRQKWQVKLSFKVAAPQ